MSKLGKAYNELVKNMAEALEPNAQVRIGQWIEGPDGKREVDVEVKGDFEGVQFFLLIECKDWKTRVDIEEIDKLDSKGKDLSADRLMICSNSGFSKKAIRKAKRLGIEAISVLASGNKLVKIRLNREYVAKALSVDQWSITLFPDEKSLSQIPQKWDARELFYDNLPLVNWLQEISADLLQQYERSRSIVATYAFKGVTEFRIQETALRLRGIRLQMNCSRKWLSQTVEENVSLGYFDFITNRLKVPDKQYWSLGLFDQDAWKEIQSEPEGYGADLVEPNSFRIDMTIMKPIAKLPECGTPEIDELIGESSVEVL